MPDGSFGQVRLDGLEQTRTPADIIDAVRRSLSTPAKWCQGHLATPSGAMCLLSALALAEDHDHPHPIVAYEYALRTTAGIMAANFILGRDPHAGKASSRTLWFEVEICGLNNAITFDRLHHTLDFAWNAAKAAETV